MEVLPFAQRQVFFEWQSQDPNQTRDIYQETQAPCAGAAMESRHLKELQPWPISTRSQTTDSVLGNESQGPFTGDLIQPKEFLCDLVGKQATTL